MCGCAVHPVPPRPDPGPFLIPPPHLFLQHQFHFHQLSRVFSLYVHCSSGGRLLHLSVSNTLSVTHTCSGVLTLRFGGRHSAEGRTGPRRAKPTGSVVRVRLQRSGCRLQQTGQNKGTKKKPQKTTDRHVFWVSAAKQKKPPLTQILLSISFAAPYRRKAFLSVLWVDGLMFAGRRKLLAPKVSELGRAERTRGSPQHRRMVLFYQMNPKACSLFHLVTAVKLRLEKYAPKAPHIYWCFNFLPLPSGFALPSLPASLPPFLPLSLPPDPFPFSSPFSMLLSFTFSPWMENVFARPS